MTEPSEQIRARYPTVAFLVTSGIGVLLLLLSFVIRVRIVVEQPTLGDVTPLVRIVWRAVLGIATLGSFALGVYDVVAGIELRGRKEKRVEISGDANDVDFHVHVTKDVRQSDLTSVDDLQSKETVRRPGLSEPVDNGTSDDESLEEL